MIELAGLVKSYGAFTALGPLDLQVRDERVIAIIGPSGSGKNDAAAPACRIGNRDVRSVRIDGVPLSGPRSGIGVVFQEPRLMPWLTVRGNVVFGVWDVAEHERAQAVDAAIARVGLTAFADALPRQLSGGMAQRVGIARALVGGPRLLLLDEPFRGARSAHARRAARSSARHCRNGGSDHDRNHTRHRRSARAQRPHHRAQRSAGPHRSRHRRRYPEAACPHVDRLRSSSKRCCSTNSSSRSFPPHPPAHERPLMSIDTLWYTRCPVPTAFSIAVQRGLLDEEFAADGVAIQSLRVSNDPAVRQSHFFAYASALVSPWRPHTAALGAVGGQRRPIDRAELERRVAGPSLRCPQAASAPPPIYAESVWGCRAASTTRSTSGARAHSRLSLPLSPHRGPHGTRCHLRRSARRKAATSKRRSRAPRTPDRSGGSARCARCSALRRSL